MGWMRDTQLYTSLTLCKAVQACLTAPHIPPPTLPTPPTSPAGGCRADCGLHVLRRQRCAARRERAPPAAHRRPQAQVLCGVSWAGGHPPRLSHAHAGCPRRMLAQQPLGGSHAAVVLAGSSAGIQLTLLNWAAATHLSAPPLNPQPAHNQCLTFCAPTVPPRLAAASATPR